MAEHAPTAPATMARRIGELLGDGLVDPAVDELRETGNDAVSGERFRRLVAALGLAPFEADLVVLAGLADEHERLAEALRRLHPAGMATPTPALACRVLCDGHDRNLVRACLDDGPLLRRGVLVTDEHVPFWDRPLWPARGLWATARGATDLPMGMDPLPAPPSGGLDGWLALAPAQRTIRACRGAEPLVVVVHAATAIDAAARGAEVVRAAGRRPVLVPQAQLTRPGDAPLWSLHLAMRDEVPVVVGDGSTATPTLAGHPGPVVVAAGEGHRLATDARAILQVRATPLALRERRELWRGVMPDRPAAADRLAGLVRVEPHRAWQAVDDLAVAASLDGGGVQVEPGTVVASIRERLGLSLPPSVRLVEPDAGWDQLVLADDQLGLLDAAVGRARHQATVLHEWGLGRGRRGVGGTKLLFSGPPGTGKTLAAETMASALGLDLLVVDLAALVSKWLGETEKNLAAVFDAADAAQAVLFFDEADALFARRTEVSDAHSRWANLETAYLLTRLEAFEGVAVLATNLRQNLDAAFVRRLDFVVEFREPDREERSALWEAHVPPDAPRDPTVDLDVIARLYPVSGGVIRNAAVAAAFDAARHARPISQRDLVTAVRREYEKAGRSFPGFPTGLDRRTGSRPEVEPCPAT